MIARILLGLIFCGVFHYAYYAYIHWVFEYAGFAYYPPSLITALFTYAFAIAPLLMWQPTRAPAAYAASLIFVLCYVPAQLMLLLNLERSAVEVLLVQAALALSMTALMRVSQVGSADVGTQAAAALPDRRLLLVVGVPTLIALGLLVATHYQYMRLVSFADVYDLRFETSEIERSPLQDYLLSWLSYCFLPFFFASGIVTRSRSYIMLGIVGCVLVYMATGSKAAILTPFIIFGMNMLLKASRDFLLGLMAVTAAAVFLVVQLVPDDGPLIWIKSILLLRVLGTSGWTISVYYDYFSTHGYTYYSHIGPIEALFGHYPYGQYSLGQLIGLHYSGNELANFNANFWASDGFAAWGLLGLLVVTAMMSSVFLAVNYVSARYSARFVTLWLSGFWLAVLNVPLTTALLSGGGGLIMLLLWSARPSRDRHCTLSGAATAPLV